MKPPLRFALAGTGFWSRYQLHGWRELAGANCVALYNRTRSKAEALAAEFGIEKVYDDYDAMLATEKIDFVDLVTGVEQHASMAAKAADAGLPVICQKPLSTTLDSAAQMVAHARQRGTALLVNENWRWQTQIRAFAETLATAPLGKIWRAHIQYANSFPVFANQPFLRELEQFILTDIGTHIFDVMRFLFGEAESVYAQTHRVTPGIKGEDAASALFRMRNGITVYTNLSYASRVPGERFPEVFITVEGEDASASLDFDFNIKVVTQKQTLTTRHPPSHYAWADARYSVVHASIVAAQRNLLAGLRGEAAAETTGADNLETLRLVFACYESARRQTVVTLR
ncbi:MAG TPA: Gfo/Idh/MocA family oxidoreductase [Opitutaceae bacterium]|nr:Gfo/Idh/MocA family oxidoreductase [Opitutaceae bacterium]